METDSNKQQYEPCTAHRANQKVRLDSGTESICTVNSDQDSHEYCALDLSSNTNKYKPTPSNLFGNNGATQVRNGIISPILSKDHDYDNESLGEDEQANLLRQYDESCRMGSGDITLFESGKSVICEQPEIEELDEINLEDTNPDTPAVLANFEDDVHEMEYSISSGLASFPSISSTSLAETSDSKISSADQNAITKAEQILLKSYEILSFLLKQNHRLAMKHETRPRTLTLRISRCDSIAMQYFVLNMKVLYVIESERN